MRQSTRTLSALAYEQGEDYDPAFGPSSEVLETLSLVAGAGPIQSEPGSYERARITRRARERADELMSYVPEWFDASDLFRVPLEA